MVRRAFTLMELMITVSIIAVLSAISVPALVSVRDAAYQFAAVQSIRGLMMATNLYTADNDDTFPLATYASAEGTVAWFGAQNASGTYDPKRGLLAPYTQGRPALDRSFQALDYMGDHSGFGYNWGYLGSDFNLTEDYRGFPNSRNPAHASEIERPSETVAFATSAFFFAPWLPGGDGKTYDFGFIDPPKFWYGRPNVDFRFGGKKVVDEGTQTVTPHGNAVFLNVDGSVRVLKIEKVNDAMFRRAGPAAEDDSGDGS